MEASHPRQRDCWLRRTTPAVPFDRCSVIWIATVEILTQLERLTNLPLPTLFDSWQLLSSRSDSQQLRWLVLIRNRANLCFQLLSQRNFMKHQQRASICFPAFERVAKNRDVARFRGRSEKHQSRNSHLQHGKFNRRFFLE